MKRTPMPPRRAPFTHARQLPSGAGQLARVSPKRRRENRERTEALRPLRAAQPWCARCGATGVGLDAHELVRRSQYVGAATDLDVIVLICRGCHIYVTENPQAAHDEGWVIWGWEHRGAAS